MRHYIPLQTDQGAWTVAYLSHRGEFVAVMECATLAVAYREAANLTAAAWGEHLRVMGGALHVPANPGQGNRYLRGFDR